MASDELLSRLPSDSFLFRSKPTDIQSNKPSKWDVEIVPPDQTSYSIIGGKRGGGRLFSSQLPKTEPIRTPGTSPFETPREIEPPSFVEPPARPGGRSRFSSDYMNRLDPGAIISKSRLNQFSGVGLGYAGALSPGVSSAFDLGLINSQLTGNLPAIGQGSGLASSLFTSQRQQQAVIPIQKTDSLFKWAVPVGGAFLFTAAFLPRPGGGGGGSKITTPPERPFVPGLPGFPDQRGFFGRSSKSDRLTSRKYGYSPSWEAIELGITGRTSQRVFTGAEIRPLLIASKRKRKGKRRKKR